MPWNALSERMQRVPGDFNEVTVEDVKECGEDLRLIDVREPDEYSGPLGHYPGSELVPMGGLLARAIDWDRDEPVVLICRSGGRSGRMAAAMERDGFSKVVSMGGGMIRYNDLYGKPSNE